MEPLCTNYAANQFKLITENSGLPSAFQPVMLSKLGVSELVASKRESKIQSPTRSGRLSKALSFVKAISPAHSAVDLIPSIDIVSASSQDEQVQFELAQNRPTKTAVLPWHTDFYLTGSGAQEEFEKTDSGVRRMLKVGRPDFDDILETMKKIAKEKGHTKVAVLTRGPNAFTRDVAVACIKHSSSDVKFDYCVGAFEL